MTIEEKRIKFAEWMGWKWFQLGAKESDVLWESPNGTREHLPYWEQDLNAMHEAEEKLEAGFDGSEQDDYQQQRYEIVNLGRSFINDFSKGGLPDVAYLQNFICATALQRFEAMGQALGLWKQGE